MNPRDPRPGLGDGPLSRWTPVQKWLITLTITTVCLVGVFATLVEMDASKKGLRPRPREGKAYFMNSPRRRSPAKTAPPHVPSGRSER